MKKSMKAIAIETPASTPTLMELPVPDIDGDEVLVRTEAIGVGLHDRWFRPGDARFPYPIGIEAAGVIQEVGSRVTGHRIGDRVMFTNSMQPKGGTWAEFSAVPEQALIPLPEGLGFVEAAALPVAGGTAIESIRSLGMSRGDTVFIAGASGAIGTLVIQLARAGGLRVAASASPRNHDYLRSLGAEETVDYHDPGWAGQVNRWMPHGVDAALAIQPGTGEASLGVVKDGGKVVTVSGDQLSTTKNIRIEQISHHPETLKSLSMLASEVASGSMRVVVEQTYPFEQGLAALEKTETRHARGKVVLTLE